MKNLEMRSSWVRVDPKQVSLKERNGRSHGHKDNGHGTMKPDIDPKPENTWSPRKLQELRRILPRAFSTTDTLF